MRPILILAASLLALPASSVLAQDKIGRAATEPLRDTRIRDDKIPPILQLAASAPYSMKGTANCAQIRDEIGRLTTALGPDVDTPAKEKGEGSAVASAAAGEVIKSIVPGLGVVRVVTGADKQQRRVEAAVYAGSVRRGYLKGLGLAKNCPPPGSPLRAARLAVPELPPAEPKK